MKSSAPLFLGLDLGGTNIKAGITNAAGKLLSFTQVLTAPIADLSARAVIQQMAAAAEAAIAQASVPRQRLRALGIVAPGALDIDRGMVLRAANFPAWKNVPLARKLSAALHLPAILENDARAAAFGEWRAGAGRRAAGNRRPRNPADPFILLTLGTGIGGGIIVGGQPLRGATGLAGEIGHTIVCPAGEPCPCGQRGCLEGFCSGTSFAHRVTKKLRDLRDQSAVSSLMPLALGRDPLTAEEIAAHARKGDAFAMRAWDAFCEALAIACINLCRVIDPEVIALSGGVAGAGQLLLQPLRTHVRRRWWSKINQPRVKIALATLGAAAGVIGAAGIAQDAVLSGRIVAPGR